MTLALCNLVLHSPDAQSERLNRLGEDRDVDIVGGEGSAKHHIDNDEEEGTIHSQENPEESAHKSDGEGEEDNSQ